MKKSSIQIKQVYRYSWLLLAFIAYLPTIYAQSRIICDSTKSVQYIDITLSGDQPYLYLQAKGADGGHEEESKGQYGGVGAFVDGYIKIGDGSGEIPAGTTIRFIPGQAGESWEHRGGGGGGSAVVANINDDWVMLLVAGGGGGAGNYQAGREGTTSTSGSNGLGSYGAKQDNAGKNGEGGENASSYGGGGYKGDGKCDSPSWACTSASGKRGIVQYEATGSPGGKAVNREGKNDNVTRTVAGGFGFGSGGAGTEDFGYSGGGGGGYSGGGGGKHEGSGGGGGSYANSTYVKSIFKRSNGTTDWPHDGFLYYEYHNSAPARNIKVAGSTNKCLYVYNGNTGNGTNIKTYNCQNIAAQAWYFHPNERSIRFKKSPGKCLDLSSNNTATGTNIQLWDCNGTDAQRWIYDGINQSFRYNHKPTKCIDIKGSASDLNKNMNVQFADCTDAIDQAWEVEGAYKVPSGAKYIVPVANQNLVVRSESHTSLGSNIQLWPKISGNDDQTWAFKGMNIKMKSYQGKCIDLKDDNHARGTNIQLWDCKNNDAQMWIYDGVTRNIRLAANPDKCMEVQDTNMAKGGNIRLWDCNGSVQQQFLIVK